MTDHARPSTSSELPFVSVVMPVRDEAAYIVRSLEAVLAQDYPAERFEVIVANGMSIDGTRAILDEYRERCPMIRVVENPGRSAPAALNTAIATARGEIIARVDGHCEIAADYIRACVRHLMHDGVDAVGGPLDTVGETYIARVTAAAMSARFGVGDSAFRTSGGSTKLTDTVAFPAYRRDVLERGGPFDEELVRNQDDEYNYRLRKLGARVLLASDVRSRYYSRASLGSLWRQYYGYGFWKVRVMQKHPQQMRPRQFAPPLFVAACLSHAIAVPFSTIALWSGAALLLAYLLASGVASALVARRTSWQLFPVLPAAFAILHVAYGTGFLVGLCRHAPWRRPAAPAADTLRRA